LADKLAGSAGNDILNGLGGSIVLGSEATGIDTIAEFANGGTAQLGAGVHALNPAFWAAAAAHDANDHTVYNRASGALSYDSTAVLPAAPYSSLPSRTIRGLPPPQLFDHPAPDFEPFGLAELYPFQHLRLKA
jgi:hypothetical protein